MANHFNNKWEIKCRTNLQKHSIWLKLKIRRSYCDLFLLFSVRRIVVAATVVDVVVFSSEICQVEVQWNSTHNKTKKKCVLGVSVLLERVCIMRGRCDAKLFTKWFISLVCVVFLVLFWKWTCSINNSVLFSAKEKLNQIFKLIKTQVPVYRAHDGDIKCGGTVLCCAVVVLLKVHNN